MNLVNIISNKERIGGLELTDTSVRFSLFRSKNQKLELATLASLELLTQEGQNDFINNNLFFSNKVRAFINKYKINYIVLSIPSDWTFAKIHSFPAIMPDEKIKDSVELIAEFQLPQKASDIYWDSIKYEDKNEAKNDKLVLVSFAKRAIIDKLIANAKKAGLKVVAVESHAISLARTIEQKPGENLLVVERNRAATSFYIIKNNELIFLQSLNSEKIKGRLNKEIKNIYNYQDWLGQTITNVFLIGNFDNKEIKNLPFGIADLKLKQKIKTNNKIGAEMFTVIGAALRGSMPRKDDTSISLMAIGTEEAYQQAKAQATASFFMGVTIALAIFFIAAFYSTWLLIATTQNNFNEQIITFNSSAGANNYSSENRAQSFNDLVAETGSLLKTEPKWSRVMSEIKLKINSGVIIKSIVLPGADGTLSLTGTANNREGVNALRQSLESSDLFTDINIPLDNLGKKSDIPFVATFKIKSPEMLYKQ